MNRASLCTAAFVFVVLAFFQSPALAGGLSFEERVKAQKAIEQVYWSPRVWPAEIPRQKPPLEAVMPDSAIRAKVVDYVRKSNALDVIWGRPITTAQLQAELARMTSQSRDPQLLQEIFAALGNDPHLIAEPRAAAGPRRSLLDDGAADRDRRSLARAVGAQG